MTRHLISIIIFAYIMGGVSLFHFYRTKYTYTNLPRWYYLGDAIVACINLCIVFIYATT